MGYNRQRYAYNRPGSAYTGGDIKTEAYRHLTIALLISAVIVLVINYLFPVSVDASGNLLVPSTLMALYTVGSVVEGVILLGLIVVSLFRIQFSESTATLLLNIFAIASSISLAAVIDFTLNGLYNGPFIVAMTFGLAGVVVFGIYAYTSANKPDVSGMYKGVMIFSILFIVVMIIGLIFFSSNPLFNLIISGVGALLFAVYMYMDFARLERREFSSPAMMALFLFIDIIYFIEFLLQFLTMIMGQRR